jgi:hypothetical protein
MNEINRAARSRQRARLAEGEKPPAPRAALALAKSKTYQSAADAPETLRALQVRLRQLQRLVRGARLPAHCRPNRRRSARISPPQAPAMRYRRCVAGWPPSLANTGWPNNRSTRAIRRSARPCAASRAICSNLSPHTACGQASSRRPTATACQTRRSWGTRLTAASRQCAHTSGAESWPRRARQECLASDRGALPFRQRHQQTGSSPTASRPSRPSNEDFSIPESRRNAINSRWGN